MQLVTEAPQSDLIEAIVSAMIAKEPGYDHAEIVELEGSNGRWHRPEGFPLGVTATGNKRTAGWAKRCRRSGCTLGMLYPSEEALRLALANARAAKVDDFRQALEAMPREELNEQGRYWVGVAFEIRRRAAGSAGRRRG